MFELDRRRLFRGEEPVYLTEAETDLLAELCNRAGEVVSRDALSSSAAAEADEAAESSGSRQVDVQVTRLRRKIEADPKQPALIGTVRGGGYIFTAPVQRTSVQRTPVQRTCERLSPEPSPAG